MSTGKPDIGILYFKNTFEQCELDEATTELEKYGLKLMAQERSPYINASIDFFVPFLQILVSPEIVAAFSQGLLTNATYEGIKALLFIENSMRNQFLKFKEERLKKNQQTFILL